MTNAQSIRGIKGQSAKITPVMKLDMIGRVIARDRELSASAVWLATVLMSYLNGTYEKAWPGQRLIAEHTGMSTNTITAAIRLLVDRGHVFVTRRPNQTSEYRFNWSKLDSVDHSDSGVAGFEGASDSDERKAESEVPESQNLPHNPETLTQRPNPEDSRVSSPSAQRLGTIEAEKASRPTEDSDYELPFDPVPPKPKPDPEPTAEQGEPLTRRPKGQKPRPELPEEYGNPAPDVPGKPKMPACQRAVWEKLLPKMIELHRENAKRDRYLAESDAKLRSRTGAMFKHNQPAHVWLAFWKTLRAKPSGDPWDYIEKTIQSVRTADNNGGHDPDMTWMPLDD